MTTKRAMATATWAWVAGDEEGNGDGGRSAGKGDDVNDDKDNNDDNDDKDNNDRDNRDDHNNNNNRGQRRPIKRYILFLIGKKCLARAYDVVVDSKWGLVPIILV